MKKVAIISTGSELIYGNVQEANAYYISGKLFPTSLKVILHITVGDIKEDLKYAVREAENKSDIIIITGGMGPTDDDYTLEILKEIYGFKTAIYEPGKDRMEYFFQTMNRKVLDNDLKQVTVPENAVIFDNHVGLASGFAYRFKGKIIIAMPGVPSEMRNMFDNDVLNFLLEEDPAARKEYLIIRTILMRESEVNNLITGMKLDFDKIDWGITTVWGMNTITFVQKGNHAFPVDQIIRESTRIFADRILSPDSENLENEVLKLLKDNNMTLSTAESCTGGLVSKRLTDIPGSSSVFKGGVIAYSNELKKKFLGVSDESLEKYGAVSSLVAEEMAKGIMDKTGSDIAISITGIAGPGGGTVEKPVGLVYFGISTVNKLESFAGEIKFDRDRFRLFASQYALDYIRIYLKSLADRDTLRAE